MFFVRLYYRIDTKKQCKSRKCLIYTVLSGERGIGYCAPIVVMLNAFPFCLPQGPLQNILLVKKLINQTLCFSHRVLCKQVCNASTIKNKRCRNIDTFLLVSYFAEREGFEPPEVLPSTVFKTAAIDHSAISPFETY